MAERLEKLIKSVKVILGERKRLARVERKVMAALNSVLGKIGYIVVPAKRAAPGRRRRGGRTAGRARPRRQMRGRRLHARAKRA